MSFLETVINGESEQVEQTEKPEPKGEESASPAPKPVEEAKPQEQVPLAALKAEREKRQASEQRMQALEQELKRLQEKPQTPAEPEDEFAFFDNPKAVLDRQRQEIRLETSALVARSKYADFDEKATLFFQEMVAQNPAVIDAMLNNPNPAEYIYNEAKKHAEFKDFSDPEAYKQKLREELRKELEAELEAKTKPRLPPDLAQAPSAGGQTTKPQWSGPTPMRDILTRK